MPIIADEIIELNRELLEAEEAGTIEDPDKFLSADFFIVRANGERQKRDDYLKVVDSKKGQGRSADQEEVRVYGDTAIYTCRVTTTLKDGAPEIGHFFNTRVFVRQGGEWQCVAWQVTKIPEAPPHAGGSQIESLSVRQVKKSLSHIAANIAVPPIEHSRS